MNTLATRRLLTITAIFWMLGAGILLFPVQNLAAQEENKLYVPLIMVAPPPLDSLQIAFLSDRTGIRQVYTMSGDGSNDAQLTSMAWYKSAISWSPDGQKILLDANPNDPVMNWDIYVMQSDGTDVINLTNNPADEGGAGWSPDGSKIVFESDRDGNNEIYVMNSDGSAQANLTNNPANDAGGAWSPDGMEIAFVSNRSGSSSLYVMAADGTNPTYLAEAALASKPAWSPDGQSIAYVFDSNVYALSLNTLIPAKLTDYAANSMSVTGAPVWSPDGVELAFSHCDCYYPSAMAELNLIRADGSDGAPRPIDQGYDPSWSPDGGYLLYGARHGAIPSWTFQIHVWVKQTAQSFQLTTDADGSNGAARWRPSVAILP